MDMILGSLSVAAGNYIHDGIGSYDGVSHPNGMEIFAASGETIYIYNNRFENLRSDYEMTYLVPSWGGASNVTFYYYNNVWTNTKYLDIDEVTSGGTNHRVYVFNNTCNSTGLCARTVSRDGPLDTVEFTNNHWITDGNPVSARATKLSFNNNLTQSTAAATAAGYTRSNGFAPASINSPTVNQGVSRASIFTTDRLGTTRPQGNAWDIGAYEFIAKYPQPPGNILVK
jgi:hypothetical protein